MKIVELNDRDRNSTVASNFLLSGTGAFLNKKPNFVVDERNHNF